MRRKKDGPVFTSVDIFEGVPIDDAPTCHEPFPAYPRDGARPRILPGGGVTSGAVWRCTTSVSPSDCGCWDWEIRLFGEHHEWLSEGFAPMGTLQPTMHPFAFGHMPTKSAALIEVQRAVGFAESWKNERQERMERAEKETVKGEVML